MLGILLTILKIIGLVLLVILGIAVVLLLCILFAPVKYDLEAAHTDTYFARFRVTYLWRIVRANGRLDADGFDFSFKILWFEPFKDKSSENEQSEDEPVIEEEPQEPAEHNAAEPNRAKSSHETLNQTNSKHESETCAQTNTINAPLPDSSSADETVMPRLGILAKVRLRLHKIKSKIIALKAPKKKPPKEPGLISKFKSIWDDEHNQNAIKHVFNVAIRLLRRIFPDTSKGDIIFSLGEPDLTGQCLGIMSLMPMFYGKHMHVRPDFESEEIYVNGNIRLIGHIRLYIFVGAAIELFRDKELKRLIKKIRK